MADFSKLKMGDTTYNVKDAEARAVTTELGATHQCIDIHDLQTTLLADGGAYDHLTPFHCTLPAGFKFTDKKTIDVPGSLTLWSALDFQAASYAGVLVLSDGTVKSVIVKTELSPIEIYAYDVASGGGGDSSADVEKLKTDVAALQTDNTTNKQDIATNKGDIADLKSDNTTNKQSISTLQDDFSSLQNDVTSLKTDNTTNKQDISSLKDDVSTLKSDNTTNKSDISSLKTGKKDVQTAVSDPTASGNALSFIDTISQDTQGKVTVSKKTVQNASTSQKGIVQTYTSLASDSDASHVPTRGAVNALQESLAKAQADIAELQKSSGGGTVTGGIRKATDWIYGVSSQQIRAITSSSNYVYYKITNGCKYPIMIPCAMRTSETASPTIVWWSIPPGKTLDVRQIGGYWVNLVDGSGKRLYEMAGTTFTMTQTFTDWEPLWETLKDIAGRDDVGLPAELGSIGVGKDVTVTFSNGVSVTNNWEARTAWLPPMIATGGPGPQMIPTGYNGVSSSLRSNMGMYDYTTNEQYSMTDMGQSYSSADSKSFTYGDVFGWYVAYTTYTKDFWTQLGMQFYHVMRSGGGPTVRISGMKSNVVSNLPNAAVISGF